MVNVDEIARPPPATRPRPAGAGEPAHRLVERLDQGEERLGVAVAGAGKDGFLVGLLLGGR
jgi:hypothetical protein